MQHSVLVYRLQQPFIHEDFTVNDRCFHIGPRCGIDNTGDRVYIEGWEGVEVAEIQNGQVRFFAGLDAADLILHAHSLSSADGCHPEDTSRIHRGRSMQRLLNHGGQPHFIEHIQVVVARRPVCAQAEMNVVMQHAGCIRDAGSQLQIGARAMADMNPAVTQNAPFLIIQPDTMRQNQTFVRQPQMIQVDNVAHAGHGLNDLNFPQVLGSMGVHLDPIAFGQVTHFPQQRLGAGDDKTRRERILNPAVAVPVPFFQQIHALLERSSCLLLQGRWRIRILLVHHHLAGQGADAAPRERLKRKIRMMYCLHIHNCRCAAGNQLSDTQHGGIIQRLLVMRCFKRPNPLAQPVHQLQIIPLAPEKRLAEMNMCLHKTGNDGTVFGVNHPLIPLRHKAAADLGNQVVPDADISIDDFFLLVHCDNLCIPDQDIGHLHRPPCLVLSISATSTKRPQKYAWAYFRSQKFTVPGRDP
ncbi:hypothetical protein D3C73_572950 [compost metagenome]